MAIISDFMSTGNILPVHNNIIGEFYSTTLTTPSNATLTINGSTFKFSPALTGKFKVSISDILKTIINQSLFSEKKPNYNLLEDFIIKGDSVYSISINIVITQGVSTDTSTVILSVYNGVKQPTDDDLLGINAGGMDLLHTKSLNGFRFIYNEGYPFDLTFYCYNGLIAPSNNIELRNTTTGNIYNLNIVTNNENRIVFCDGRTDITIENIMPLLNGVNKMKLTAIDNPTNFIFFDIEKRENVIGSYIKWMNEFGTWNYWMFNEFSEVNESIKPVGFINKDTLSIEQTLSPNPSLGVNDETEIKLNSGIISPEDYSYFYSIFKSPKIYLYTGSRFAQKTNTQWQEVTIDGSFNTKKAKGINHTFDIGFSIGKIFTQGI